MSTIDDRIEALKKIKIPTILADLETYLGMATFLRRFIYGFQMKVEPLEVCKTILLKKLREEGQTIEKINKKARTFKMRKVSFEPSRAEKESFEILQDYLMKKMTLYHHNPRRPIFFKLDASGRGMGLFVFHL